MITSDLFASQPIRPEARRPETRRPEDEAQAADRQTTSLAGLAVVLLLVVASLQLIHVLSASASVEDCLMAGRTNCDAVARALPAG